MSESMSCIRPGGLELTRRGLELCSFPAQSVIADIGCGAGASARFMRDMGHFAVGLDPSTLGGSAPMVRARAENIPFAPSSLHGIVCECVLCLLENTKQILNNFASACRPGGRLLLSDVYIKTENSGISSAMPGLVTRSSLESAMRGAGWEMEHFEDHSRALREFAAQMLWHCSDAADVYRSVPWRECGYGLWVARKR